MPPKETKSQLKCVDMVKKFIADLKTDESDSNIFIGRATKNLGNKSFEAMIDSSGIKTIQFKIPGKFSGRGRKGVMISVGSFLLLAKDDTINKYEMLALIEDKFIKSIGKLTPINPVILNCIKEEKTPDDIEFDRGDVSEEELALEESDIDEI